MQFFFGVGVTVFALLVLMSLGVWTRGDAQQRWGVQVLWGIVAYSVILVVVGYWLGRGL